MVGDDLSQIARRVREARRAFESELADISAEEAGRGSSWSVADLVRHMRGRFYYLTLAERVLSGEEVPSLPRPSMEEYWRHTVNQVLKDMDETVAWLEGLREEDLERTFGEGKDMRTVRYLLEIAASHYEEHLEQLRSETKPALEAGRS